MSSPILPSPSHSPDDLFLHPAYIQELDDADHLTLLPSSRTAEHFNPAATYSIYCFIPSVSKSDSILFKCIVRTQLPRQSCCMSHDEYN